MMIVMADSNDGSNDGTATVVVTGIVAMMVQ